jgi:hypothetical protein
VTILKEQVLAVTENAEQYRLAQAYYHGNTRESLHDLGSNSLRRALRATQHRGSHNYCRIIVDSVLNRMEISNVLSDKPTVQKKINEIWKNNELHLESTEAHRLALEFGDAYAFAWPDEDGEVEISFVSPLEAAVVYDPSRPRKKLYAVKMWKESENVSRLNIYNDDTIVKFKADTVDPTEATNWTQTGTEENPFGEIPVFHFRTRRPFGVPEHIEAYGAQNDINKLLATHMYTVDYQGAPQRYALAATKSDGIDFGDDDTGDDINSLKSSPNGVWYMQGVNQIGQFQPADPKVFWEPINALKQSMAALTDTPYHFLERSANVASGDALRVSEAPLMKKVESRQDSFEVTWTEMFRFILEVIEQMPESELEVKWDVVESMDQLNEWDINIKKLNGGMSKHQMFREAGYSEEEIERILEEAAEEKKSAMAFTPTDPNAPTSTDDNKDGLPVSGATEASNSDGGHPTPANVATADAAKKSSAGQVNK